MNCKMKCWKIGVLVLLGIAALGWVVMALWNWLIPTLFDGGRQIDYVQAMGVLLLSKILFGGFRGGHKCHERWHQHRLEKMTPEEREKFQSGMRGCCGSKHKPEETENS
ncbi:MAG: hypothetical protein HY306_13775 [Nitrosomonadales bacterium]|nr:hypothetical protein [Nitrosomonadales bacterium]